EKTSRNNPKSIYSDEGEESRDILGKFWMRGWLRSHRLKIRIDLLKIMRKIRHKGRREQVFTSKRTYGRQRDKKKWEKLP
ncbi:MAG: hypothetical protein JSW13_05915, partial [Candidatus Aerophobus sp.]